MSVMALILALVSVISILVTVAYYGQMRYYRALFAKEKKQRKQYWQTIIEMGKRIVELKQKMSGQAIDYYTYTTNWQHEKRDLEGKIEALKTEKEELEEMFEGQLTIISGQDDQIRELKHTIDGLEKLIEMKDEEINEMELGSPAEHLRNQLKLLSKEITNKCNDIRNLRGDVLDLKELLRLAEEANIGQVQQIHQLQADKAKVLAEFKDYRIFMIDDEIDTPEVNDTYFAHQNKNGFVYKWWKEERELAAKQIVEEELTASPEPCTEMGTKPADKRA